MNNKNKMLVGCLALLLVLSVGYALFSETITINGTATAKGNFDITTTCQTGISSAIENVYAFQKDNNFSNDSCIVKDNVVTVNTELSMPTALRNFTVKMTNSGTIPAVYPMDGTYYGNTNACVIDSITGEEISCDSMVKEGEGSYSNGYTDWIFILEDKNGNIYELGQKLEEMIEGTGQSDNMILDEENGVINLLLNPGESLYYVMVFEWLDGIEKNLKKNQHYVFKHDFEFNWQQITTN